MKRIITSLLMCIVIVCSTSKINVEAYAGDLVHDQSVLRAMEDNPKHYYFGHGFGTGAGTYVDINTIAVELYNPPEYIISYDSIVYNCGPKTKLTAKKRSCLYFNYDKQEAYYGVITENNERQWHYIAPGKTHSIDQEADMIFIIAYNMHFYKNSNYQSGYLKGWVSDAQQFISTPYNNTGCEGRMLK